MGWKARFRDGFSRQMFYDPPMSETIKQMILATVEKFPQSEALLYKEKKEWQRVRYDELLTRAKCVSEILHEQGVQHGDRVALWRENHHEWAEAYLGIVCLGAIAVPIDAKLRPQESVHIFQDSEAKILLTGEKYVPMMQEIESQLSFLDTVVISCAGKIDLEAEAEASRCTYVDYHQAIESVWATASGKDHAFGRSNLDTDNLASLIYTSGTTGKAKGVMLSHGNFLANINGAGKIWPFDQTDNFLLVLPLHHAFAFTGNFLLPLSVGATISFVQNLRTVGDNMREVSPTFFMGVPLLLEKMYSRLQDGLKTNKTAQVLMKIGLGKLVGRAVVKKLGGRLKIIITGAAPCDPEIIAGFRKLGIHVLEGYGLTEASPVLAANLPGRIKLGTVGVAFEGVDLEIRDPNDQGIGEIVARGPNIMQGYYQQPEATAEVLQDGWLLTGDLGFIDKDGYLKITGRKKSLIVNREGKNIYPEEVEMAVNQSPWILESLVLGYQESSDTVGERVGIIVVPDQDRLNQEHPGLDKEARDDLIKGEVRKQVSELSDYKRPRSIRLRYEEFQKTSTQKVKRYLYSIGMEEL